MVPAYFSVVKPFAHSAMRGCVSRLWYEMTMVEGRAGGAAGGRPF